MSALVHYTFTYSAFIFNGALLICCATLWNNICNNTLAQFAGLLYTTCGSASNISTQIYACAIYTSAILTKKIAALFILFAFISIEIVLTKAIIASVHGARVIVVTFCVSIAFLRTTSNIEPNNL